MIALVARPAAFFLAFSLSSILSIFFLIFDFYYYFPPSFCTSPFFLCVFPLKRGGLVKKQQQGLGGLEPGTSAFNDGCLNQLVILTSDICHKAQTVCLKVIYLKKNKGLQWYSVLKMFLCQYQHQQYQLKYIHLWPKRTITEFALFKNGKYKIKKRKTRGSNYIPIFHKFAQPW